MSGRLAIDALRQGRSWGHPILLPSAVGLGARIDAQPQGLVWYDPQKLADACVAAARYLGADALWVPAFGSPDLPDLDALNHRDAAQRAIAAADRLQMGCVVEIRGPLARALALGGDLDEALKQIKPDVIAEFEGGVAQIFVGQQPQIKAEGLRQFCDADQVGFLFGNGTGQNREAKARLGQLHGAGDRV